MSKGDSMVFTDTVLEAGAPGAQRIDMLTWLKMKLQKLGDTFKYITCVLEYEGQQSVGMDLLANLPRTPLSRLDLDLDVSPNDFLFLSEVCTATGSSRGMFSLVGSNWQRRLSGGAACLKETAFCCNTLGEVCTVAGSTHVGQSRMLSISRWVNI